MDYTTDQELAAAVRDSDRNAFKLLYHKYYKPLYLFLRHRTRSGDLAQDFVQELFTRIWAHRRNIDPSKSLKAYLYRIANNLVIDHFRKRKSDLSYRSNLDLSPSGKNAIETQITIMTAIDHLPEKLKSVFTMSRFEGLTYQEIADICRISIKTVESRMSQALKRLRKEISA
jgi:RNA polymerase sigma-70 factor, ECF subfamily